MKTKPLATQKYEDQLQKLRTLWPALKGSLAKVYKPCIRKNCPACARGDNHPAWLLSFTRGSRRRCLYVPLGLVPTIRRALRNGRRIEQLLYRMGPTLVKDYRQILLKRRLIPGELQKS